MKTVYAFLAANRYWPDKARLQQVFAELTARLSCTEKAVLLTDEENDLPDGDCVVLVPLSGAVQKKLLQSAAKFSTAVLYCAYVTGNASADTCDELLRANAAPTIMDTWAVLHRQNPRVLLALNENSLREHLRVLDVFCFVHGANVLQIGRTEPWVVSNASSPRIYEERFGVHIVPVAQQELEDGFTAATQEQAAPYHAWFVQNAAACKEPTENDLWNAARMAYALDALLQKYHARAAALACFALLRTGTTACMGVSYLNTMTEKCVSCEGDLDSVLTMLLMKKLSDTPLWMANPALNPDGTIHFSHCTAPLFWGSQALPYVLRSHHESGIGVSTQVAFPISCPVTACRISNEAQDMTIHTGHTVSGAYRTACRTQATVLLDDFDHYLQTALGCHQVFSFSDISAPLHTAAKLFGLKIL